MIEPMTAAQYLAQTLPRYGVTHVFELVGGMITTLLDALHRQPEITVVSCLHEQAAAFAAEGYARLSGRPSVAMATSGPGATNLLTGVGSCYFDSVPVVFITGQVNRSEARVAGRGRQGGFQETDIVAMASPVTKWATSVPEGSVFPSMLDDAFEIASSGRPGPVLLDIPMDVQREFVTNSPWHRDTSNPAHQQEPSATAVLSFAQEVSNALWSAERPLIVAGGGIRSSGSVDAFRDLVERSGVPVVASLLGLDVLPSGVPARVGFLGSYGNRWTNQAIAASDTLLVLGSRLDVRQTGSDTVGFKRNRRVFHVDIDESELNNHVTGCTVLNSDVKDFLEAMSSQDLPSPVRWVDWVGRIKELEQLSPDESENIPRLGLNPNTAIRKISRAWTDVSAFVTDVGQHQMWSAQSIQLTSSQRFITSGGMGAMGFGLPAALGAALAARGAPVCLIAGDGGFQCNVQELQTLSRLSLPIRIVIFDNNSHGMVRQFQQSHFGSRYFSSTWGYEPPDFVRLAHAYGLPAQRINTDADLDEALLAVRRQPAGPSLMVLHIEQDLNVYPKLAFGREYGAMEPDVNPTAMEGT